MNRIAVLGSTGSIGTNCLDVIADQQPRMSLVGATANTSWRELADQSQRFCMPTAIVCDDTLRDEIDKSEFNSDTEIRFGHDAVEDLARSETVDTVVSAIVGAAGLRGTWAAVDAGKRVAIANKETLVVAGPLITDLARRTGATMLPVDSEHSAIFQAMQAGKRGEIERIVLTASGGPFRGWSRQQLESVTPDMALQHPTWSMGPKITVDSATLMNKALEIIEARWLFDIEPDRIGVVIHPQSILHSFAEFVDGSVIGQMSPPDMKLPIQYALTWPDRSPGISPKLDWTQAMTLELLPPDRDAFPALKLGYEVAERGGTCGVVLNAANEIAVARFLAGDLQFEGIPQACRAVLDEHHFEPAPNLSTLLRLDEWARAETAKWTS